MKLRTITYVLELLPFGDVAFANDSYKRETTKLDWRLVFFLHNSSALLNITLIPGDTPQLDNLYILLGKFSLSFDIAAMY